VIGHSFTSFSIWAHLQLVDKGPLPSKDLMFEFRRSLRSTHLPNHDLESANGSGHAVPRIMHASHRLQHYWLRQSTACYPNRTGASRERDLCLGGDSATTAAVASPRKWNHRHATPHYLQHVRSGLCEEYQLRKRDFRQYGS
jgi:hypothetical protein